MWPEFIFKNMNEFVYNLTRFVSKHIFNLSSDSPKINWYKLCHSFSKHKVILSVSLRQYNRAIVIAINY